MNLDPVVATYYGVGMDTAYRSAAFPNRTFRTASAAAAATRYADDTAQVRFLLMRAQGERAHNNWPAVVALLGEAAAIRPQLAAAHVAAGTAVSAADWRHAFRLADNYIGAALASQSRGRREAASMLDFTNL